MNKKMLCTALLGALGFATAASAQEFDDRWYLTIGPHLLDTDRDRDTANEWGFQLGFGRFVNPNLSIDIELVHTNPQKESHELNWSLYGAGVYGRYHFKDEGRTWWPYLSAGLGALRHEDEFINPAHGRPIDRKGTNLFAAVGAGLQADIGARTAIRTEVSYRGDFDDESGLGEKWFGDIVYSLNLVVKFGGAPGATVVEQAPPPPPPRVPHCSELDDDRDGVNNCDDRCPDSQPGQAVGPDGCPVPLTIDLRGVNFDFDKATLRPDAVMILNEAIEILKKYPELRVEVAGHTDSIGTDQYNQRLSERRARAVYDYLGANGIGANRLAGPNGYGESRPIAPNTNPDGSDNPEGRAKNRRTELNVQN
jgi:OmpA-OmpF porin, OOP family